MITVFKDAYFLGKFDALQETELLEWSNSRKGAAVETHISWQELRTQSLKYKILSYSAVETEGRSRRRRH